MQKEGDTFVVGIGGAVWAEVVEQEGEALMAGEGGGVRAEDV